MNNTNKNLAIFSKYIKNKTKLIPFNIKTCDIGITKYLPPVSKEWKNSIYVFNPNNIKNLPIYDVNINSLLKNYFNLHFNSEFLFKKHISRKKKRLSLNKIFVSKAEIKHTNTKAILTVYTYNREKISLLKKIKLLKKSFYSNIKLLMSKKKNKLSYGYPDNLYNKGIKVLLNQELILLRKYKLTLNLNKSKFEEKLLYKLKNLIIKYYNKKVEFNIVNLRSIMLNSDIFTKILTLKLKNRKASVLRMMKIILNKVILAKKKGIIAKDFSIKIENLLENKFKNLNLNSILKENNLSELLNRLYYNIILNNNFNKGLGFIKIYEIIFDSINYKNMAGVRLEVKGRLSKRYRADKALFKVRFKGGLKNIDSSYKGLSSVNMRGYAKPNVEYSIFTSKRRIGSFAVKGWVSGK